MDLTRWKVPGGNDRWSKSATTYETSDAANRKSIAKGKGRITGEYRTSSGNIKLRVGQRAVRVRSWAQKIDRHIDEVFGSMEVKNKIKAIKANHRFDKAVCEFVEDAANGKMEPKDLKARIAMLEKEKETFIKTRNELAGYFVEEDDVTFRFQDVVEDALSLLHASGMSQKYDRAVSVLSAYKFEDNALQNASALGRMELDNNPDAFIDPDECDEYFAFVLAVEANTIPEARAASIEGADKYQLEQQIKATTREKDAALSAERAPIDLRNPHDTKPYANDTLRAHGFKIKGVANGDIRRLDLLKLSKPAFGDGMKHMPNKGFDGLAVDRVESNISRVAESIEHLSGKDLARAGAMANVKAEHHDIKDALEGTRCAFLGEFHQMSHNREIGEKVLMALQDDPDKKPVIMFETRPFSNPKDGDEACAYLNEKARLLQKDRTKSNSEKAMLMAAYCNYVDTIPDKLKGPRSPATHEKYQSKFNRPMSSEALEVDKDTQDKIDTNQVVMGNYALFKKAFENKVSIDFVPATREQDGAGKNHGGMSAAIKNQIEKGKYPLCFFGAAHGLEKYEQMKDTIDGLNIDPDSMNLAQRYDGVSIISEANMEMISVHNERFGDGTIELASKVIGTVQKPAISASGGVCGGGMSELMAVRSSEHQAQFEAAQRQTISPEFI